MDLRFQVKEMEAELLVEMKHLQVEELELKLGEMDVKNHAKNGVNSQVYHSHVKNDLKDHLNNNLPENGARRISKEVR